MIDAGAHRGHRACRARGAAALVLCAVLCAVPGWGGAAGAEREFATIVAFGYTAPVDSNQGQWSPVLVLDYESDGHALDGRFRFALETSTARAEMRHHLPPLALGYHALGVVIAEGDGLDLFDDGERRDELTFRGNSFGAGASVVLFPGEPWQASWQAERRHARFETADHTQPDFVLPGDLTQVEHQVAGERHGLLGHEDARLSLSGVAGRRSDWRPWSLDADAAAHARYRRHALRWDQPAEWAGGDRSRLRLALLGGSDLDLLSGYRLGGFASREVVAGYYRNEFRAARAAVLNLEHEWRFAGDVRLSALLDAARLDELPLAFRARPPERRTLAGVGVGLYLPLDFLAGAPLIVRYGEGLRVPDGSPEGERREVLLVLAGGF